MSDLSLDDAVASTMGGSATQLRNSMAQAFPVNPDQYATSKRYAAAAQVPIETAQAMPVEIKTQAQLAALNTNTLAQKFPHTAAWLSTPGNAMLAHDDVPATTAVEQHVKALGGGSPGAFLDPETTAPSYGSRLTAWLRDLVGMQPAGRDEGAAARAFLDRTAAQMGTTRDALREAVGGVSPIPQQFAQGYFESATAGLAPESAGAPDTVGGNIARGAGTLAGFITGAPLKIAASVAERIPGLAPTVGQSFIKGIGRDVTRQAATLGLASGITSAGSALDTGTAGDAAGVVGKATGSGAAMGAVFGAAGRLFPDNTVLQIGARALGVNATLDAMNGSRPWDDRPLAQKVFDYGLNSVFALNGAGRTAGGWLHDAARADLATSDAVLLGNLADAASASKLRERDPAAFAQFVRNAAEDGPVPAVYVDGRALAESLHQAGIGTDELNAKLPSMAEQLPEALATGGQVRIPVEDFATHIAGGPLQAPLMQHLRTSPEGMTHAESQAFYQSHVETLTAAGDAMREQAAVDAPAAASRRQVIENVKAQLAATGRFPDGVSDAYAALHGTFYATQAERLGVLPHELLERYPVRIAAESPTADTLSAPGQRGAFDPSTKTIAILKGADLSTFLHESGHHFLDALSHMAYAKDAPAGIKTDMQTLLKSYNVPDVETWHLMSLDEQRESHEKFARGFESYLMDGKAPDLEMRGLFSRFRSWLVHIYKSLSALKVELTPEVRGVMDRLLASDDAIKRAETARAYMPLFDSPEKAGMSAQDWSAYQAIGKDATDQAIDGLTSKTVRDLAYSDRTRNRALKALGLEADAKRQAIQMELHAEVMKAPIYRAWAFLTGRDQLGRPHDDPTTGTGKLKTSDLRGLVGEDVVQRLIAQKMTSEKNGIDPGLVAEMFGFRDGAQLATSLTLAENPKSVLEGIVEQRMLERHGEIASPEALARAADEAVHNEVRTRFVATELKTLNKAIGPARELAKAAKDVAESTIDAKRVRDIAEGQYGVAETKAAKAAEKRMATGDTAGAAVAKRDQLLNMELGRAARAGLEYVDSSVDYLKRFDNASVREGIDLEYRDQIDALLDRFDIRRSVSGKALDKREALNDFVERMSAQGYEPQIPERLLDEAARTHYKDMRLLEFKGLVDAVKSIEHLGKLKSKLLDLQESREISDLADEVKASAGELKQRAKETNRGLNRIEEAWLSTKAAGRSLGASLLKMEQMMDWLDGRNPNGTLNRVVFRRIADAGVRENDMLKTVKAEIDKLVASHLPDVTKDGGKVYEAKGLVDGLTGEPQRFTKKQMLMLAGNMGNESNAAKLTAGEKWNQLEVWSFLNAHMSKADWDFVAGMGKAIEGLWPEKLAMSRRLGNTNPEKIEPRPFDTPHGRYEGWYWPLIYDPARAQDVAERGAKAGDALFENVYSRANSDTGRMNTRNENYARPMLLDFDAIPRVIKDEIHDIAFREAVIDADRFLSHSVVRKSIIDALSQQHYDQLRPWLQSIANDGKSSTESMRALKFFSDVASGVRTRATMIGLGYRISTILVHGSSAALESVAELGPVWFASGLKDFANPLQWSANKDFIFERSGEMRNRMNEVDRDVREHLRTIDTHMMDPTTGTMARGADSFRAHAYTAIAGLDMASALPTWMGAYKKGLTPEGSGGLGMSEADAVYFADKTVRNAHGGTGVKDLAAVQRGPELMKLFTMFYTFWNHNVNRLMDTGRLAMDAKTWHDPELAATVIVRTLVYTLGVQAMHSLVHPPKDGDDQEGWMKWAAKEFTASAFAGIPVLRDLSAHYLSGKDYSVTPAAGLVKMVGNSATDAMNLAAGKQANPRWLKHTMTTAGAAFNLPLGQPASTAQFLWDVADGKQHPATATDWWNGVLHGDIKKH